MSKKSAPSLTHKSRLSTYVPKLRPTTVKRLPQTAPPPHREALHRSTLTPNLANSIIEKPQMKPAKKTTTAKKTPAQQKATKQEPKKEVLPDWIIDLPANEPFSWVFTRDTAQVIDDLLNEVQSKVDGSYKKELLNVYTEFCGNVQKRGNYIHYNPNDLLRVRLKLKEKQIEPIVFVDGNVPEANLGRHFFLLKHGPSVKAIIDKDHKYERLLCDSTKMEQLREVASKMAIRSQLFEDETIEREGNYYVPMEALIDLYESGVPVQYFDNFYNNE